MKNILLLGLSILVLIALFGDGGLEVSPTVSPSLEFSPALEFKPNVSYAPDRSVTTNNIETNIEHQTVIVQAPPSSVNDGAAAGGVTLIDGESPAGPGCANLYPGEQIYNGPDLQGACFVENAEGQKFFINRMGTRWLLGGSVAEANGAGTQPALQAPDAGVSLDQLQAAFLRNGGQLPWFWDTRSEAAQMDWLKEQSETWK
ncbi:MAG: hypothetical protein IPL32_19630 [Chloracidobacterium sp.]|nr:hypothetical protein [Chloracidobacterium sp.]